MSNNNRILIKSDRELGWAYFCPHCKTFQCVERDACSKCGGKLDWKNIKPYLGRVKWG